MESALVLFVLLKIPHAEANTWASSVAISDNANRSAVSHKGVAPTILFATDTILPHPYKYPHPFLDPAVSSVFYFLVFFSPLSMKLHKGQTGSVAPTSCHLIFRPCQHPENSLAPAL